MEPGLSRIFNDLASDAERERICVGDFLSAFAQRSFGALIFLFAVPNLLPTPIVGLSTLLGAPLVFITWQLMIGQPQPWLPGFIRERSLERTTFAGLASRVIPVLHRIERLIRPRLLFCTHRTGERLIGALGFVLAIILILPIPLGNILPALALTLLALGVVMRDGVLVLAGGVTATVALVIVAGVLYGVARTALFVLMTLLPVT